MSSIDKLIQYLATSLEDAKLTSTSWRCISFTANTESQCKGKRVKDMEHCMLQAQSLQKHLEQFIQLKKSTAQVDLFNAYNTAKSMVEDLVCNDLHRWHVMHMISDHLHSKPVTATKKSPAKNSATSEQDDGQTSEPTSPNAQVADKNIKASGTRPPLSKLNAFPITPPRQTTRPRIQSQARRSGTLDETKGKFQGHGISSPGSDISTPGSSQEDIFDYDVSSPSVFTPDSTMSTLSGYSSQSYATGTPTRAGRDRNSNHSNNGDEDSLDGDDVEDLSPNVKQDIQNRAATKGILFKLSKKKLEAATDQLKTPDSGKQANLNKAASRRKKKGPTREGQHIEPYLKEKKHTQETKFHVAQVMEQKLGKKAKKKGILYIAEDIESTVSQPCEKSTICTRAIQRGHYKLGFTTRSVYERYVKEDCKRSLIFHYRSPKEFVGAHRVERLVQEELSHYRRWVRNCGWCSINHMEWFEIDCGVLQACVVKWTLFVNLPAYDKTGVLTRKASDMIHGMWTWKGFLKVMEKKTEDVSYPLALGYVDAKGLRDMHVFEAKLEEDVKALKKEPKVQKEREGIKHGAKEDKDVLVKLIQPLAGITNHPQGEIISDGNRENRKPLGEKDGNQTINRRGVKPTAPEESLPRKTLQRSSTWASIQASKAKSYHSDMVDGLKRLMLGRNKAPAADTRSLASVGFGDERSEEIKGTRRQMIEGWRKTVKFRL